VTPQYLFAYGTLLSGALEPEVDVVLRRHCRLGPAATVAGYLLDLGEYPGALPARTPGQRVRGHLLELLAPARCLPLFDQYEGFDPAAPSASLYLRERVSATLDEDRERVDCWIYWLRRKPRAARIIPGGDWMAYVESRRRGGR